MVKHMNFVKYLTSSLSFKCFHRIPSDSSSLFPLHLSVSSHLPRLISCLFPPVYPSSLLASLDLWHPLTPSGLAAQAPQPSYLYHSALSPTSECIRKRKKKHFGDFSTWPRYPLLASKLLLLPDLLRATSGNRDDCAVGDKRLVWDQYSQTASAPRSSFRSSFPTAAEADSVQTERPSKVKISGWLQNRSLGWDGRGKKKRRKKGASSSCRKRER